MDPAQEAPAGFFKKRMFHREHALLQRPPFVLQLALPHPTKGHQSLSVKKYIYIGGAVIYLFWSTGL